MLLIDIESTDPRSLIIPEHEQDELSLRHLFSVILIHPLAKALAHKYLPETKACIEHDGSTHMVYLGTDSPRLGWTYHPLVCSGPFPSDERGIPYDDPDLDEFILQKLKQAELLNLASITVVWADGIIVQCNRIISRLVEVEGVDL